MRNLRDFSSIYLCSKPLDMRLSFSGLSHATKLVMEKDVYTSSLFVFYNKKKTLLKILYWDQTGFALWIKKLEKDRFKIPHKKFDGGSILLTSEQLDWLLSGVDFEKIKPHKNLCYSAVF